MSNTIKLSKWGNGQGFLLPKKLIQKLDLNIGDELVYDIVDGKIIFSKYRGIIVKSKYTIEELLKDMPKGCKGKVIDTGKPVGKEIIHKERIEDE